MDKKINVNGEKWEKMKIKLINNKLTIVKFFELIINKTLYDKKFFNEILKELENENEL